MNRQVASALAIALIFCVLLSLCACNAQIPTQSEVEEAYHKATEANEWFSLCTQDSNKMLKGSYFFKVKEDWFQTLAELKAYLETLFSPEYTALLIENGTYTDIDGQLCVLPVSRERNITVGEQETYSVTKKSNTKLIFHVTVDIVVPGTQTATPVGTQTFDFPYENIDGTWVFTDFPTIR